MDTPSQIVARVREDAPNILSGWARERGIGVEEDEALRRMRSCMEELLSVFAGFLDSPEGVSTFNRGGGIRTLVSRIAEDQRALGRDAVGVIEDFAVLRRLVWRSVEDGVDLAGMHGGEVALFFVKLMQASDWVTEKGLEAFDAAAHRDMERALGRAATTDLVTGLPDRERFNRLLLPDAVREHQKLAVIVFDVVNFTETVAEGNLGRARDVLRRLASAVRETVGEGAIVARFGDDEVCAILPERSSEDAYGVAEKVLKRVSRDPDGFEADAGVAEYPAHATSPGLLMAEAAKALKMAKRAGGSGIVIAR